MSPLHWFFVTWVLGFASQPVVWQFETEAQCEAGRARVLKDRTNSAVTLPSFHIQVTPCIAAEAVTP